MKYILTLFALLQIMPAYALEVVYPKTSEVTIQSSKTFFIGSSNADKPLTINGENVPVHKSGGFAHVVELQAGENEFVLESGSEKQIYKIINPEKKQILDSENKLISFQEPLFVLTSKDLSPLRSTPIASGTNRIAHYQQGVPLKVVGEQGEFYQVELSPERKAWIGKVNVQQAEIVESAMILDNSQLEDKDSYIFNIEFDKKVPYVIESGYPFVVKFYNVEGYENSTYTFSFPLTQKLAGYSGNFEGNTFVLKIRKFPEINEDKPLKDIKIVIDAGHGGYELGAIGCLGHREKNINLDIARLLADELNSRGAYVIMTRNGDKFVPLSERVDITNRNDAMIFISIHGNALPDGQNPLENSGTSIYYYYPQAKPLADSIIKEMTEALPFSDDKVRRGSLAVVRNTNALSILIEVGYLINPEDNWNLLNKDVQKQTSKAIADGIEEFLK